MLQDSKYFQEIASNIFQFYNESHRHYHNWKHIQDCLKELEDVKDNINDYTATYLAILFHDIVYNPKENNNEVESGFFAYKFIRSIPLPVSLQILMQPMQEFMSQKVMHMILCTLKHEVLDNAKYHNDIEYFIDIDLSILGKSEVEFSYYERGIRMEYEFVPENIYKTERVKILQQFLDRDHIYFTEYFRDKYEENAIMNITTSIKKLTE